MVNYIFGILVFSETLYRLYPCESWVWACRIL